MIHRRNNLLDNPIPRGLDNLLMKIVQLLRNMIFLLDILFHLAYLLRNAVFGIHLLNSRGESSREIRGGRLDLRSEDGEPFDGDRAILVCVGRSGCRGCPRWGSPAAAARTAHGSASSSRAFSCAEASLLGVSDSLG
ncbi:hypothetical protein ACHAWX_007666 [Stephanocyclus meneghinianus]